jgi:hypothetical protein
MKLFERFQRSHQVHDLPRSAITPPQRYDESRVKELYVKVEEEEDENKKMKQREITHKAPNSHTNPRLRSLLRILPWLLSLGTFVSISWYLNIQVVQIHSSSNHLTLETNLSTSTTSSSSTSTHSPITLHPITTTTTDAIVPATTKAPPPVEVIQIDEIPTREYFEMQELFYQWTGPLDSTSTTIIFNVFLGDESLLELQLKTALRQENVEPPEIWVNAFNSPKEEIFRQIVNKVSEERPEGTKPIVFTSSPFNFKFHGRFLLAYMAKTKYVLIIDDDVFIETKTLSQLHGYMKLRRGVWGSSGHLRAPTFKEYRGWPLKKFDLETTEYAEVDYLCGMWFLEQSWLEYFFKERMPSWETAEDMHLSHTIRKFLNLNSYGGKIAVGLSFDIQAKKQYKATHGKALELREYIFDHQLGRGNKVADVLQPIDTLVYAETVGHIEDFSAKIIACKKQRKELRRTLPWCSKKRGRVAVVFRGAKEQNVPAMIEAAKALCNQTKCTYYSVKPWIYHPIEYFNMREGFGQEQEDLPWQTSVSDILTSLIGILNNLQPRRFYVPNIANQEWDQDLVATKSIKKNRLEIYHSTVKLAVQIYMNQRLNVKASEVPELVQKSLTGFPKTRTYIWEPMILPSQLPLATSTTKTMKTEEGKQLPVAKSTTKTMKATEGKQLPVAKSTTKTMKATEGKQLPVATSTTKSMKTKEPVATSTAKTMKTEEGKQLPVATSTAKTMKIEEGKQLPVATTGGGGGEEEEEDKELAIPLQKGDLEEKIKEEKEFQVEGTQGKEQAQETTNNFPPPPSLHEKERIEKELEQLKKRREERQVLLVQRQIKPEYRTKVEILLFD